MTEFFLDASYAIALSSPPDQYHARAVALAAQVGREKRRLITTQAVVLEIGNALAKQRYRDAGARLLNVLEKDPSVEVVLLSADLFARAAKLYRDRLDKEWGLTDCVSFVVMQDRNLTEALTTDDHFRQAGYRALLIEA